MRILLADSQAKVRFALRVLLERQPGLEVVGEAASAEELLADTAACRPDLVLLDWTLVSRGTPGLLGALRHGRPGLGIIVLSGRPETREAALVAGADAFVSKGNPPEHLLTAINGWCCASSGAAAAGSVLPADVLAA